MTLLLTPFLTPSIPGAQAATVNLDQSENSTITPHSNHMSAPGVVEIISHKNTLSWKCSASVVGLNPVTLITARHCVDLKTEVLVNGITPIRSVVLEFNNSQFIEPSASHFSLSADIAVLIFSHEDSKKFTIQREDVFTVAPVNYKWADPVTLCGSYSPRNKTRHEQCNTHFLVTSNQDFQFSDIQNELDLKYRHETSDRNFLEADIVKYIHFCLQRFLNAYGAGTRIGVAGFSLEAFYKDFSTGLDPDGEASLLEKGDSGGPWLIRRDGRNHLIGVSTNGAPYTAYGWTINQPWTKELLKKAARQGADIRELEQLVR